ncbi:hypothetical protein [Deinococcus sp. Leaf326]|uniref:hypothetical protein n=1 Tax=Deinococcus sp. Leaf326 TaxID=1736338 RepID=UPI0006FA5C55|nr:hypothetical protein [Deinococcus sp. Leaf326]KQR37714.1 hypothetical protein ASF71_14635 [Deinococcus sp. Leaf326]
MPRLKPAAERLKRAALYTLRAGLPLGGEFWDGVAWFGRMVLIVVHLSFALPALYRPNTPLLLTSYSAFDDVVPFTWWGLIGLGIALLLWLLPPRVPWGILSTTISAGYLYFVAALFWQAVGSISAVNLYFSAGALSGLLLMRALWAWFEPQPWFREHVLKRPVPKVGRHGG